MKTIRTILTVAVVAMLSLSLAQPASAWPKPKIKINKKKKFDKKPTEKILKEMDEVNATFAEGSAKMWEAVELFQSVIGPYAEGEFPILTKNWKAIKEEVAKAEDKVKDQMLIDLRKGYIKEIQARKKFIEDMMKDPAKTTGVQAKFQTEDIDKLKKLPGMIEAAIKLDKKAVDMAKKVTPKVPKEVERLSKAAADDPLKAADYKSLINQLKKGQERVNKVPPEAAKQIEAGTAMTGQVQKLIKK